MILEFKSNLSELEVFAYLTDMQKFCSIHPVIYKITPTNKKDNFLIYEKLNWGLIPFSFNYPAKVISNYESMDVRMHARIFIMVNIHLTFKFKSSLEHTHITELVKVQSIFPIKWLVYRILRTQHTILFKNMNSESTLETSE